MRQNAPESVLFSKFFRGSMPPDPPSMASRLCRSLNWPDQIRFPSDGPVTQENYFVGLFSFDPNLLGSDSSTQTPRRFKPISNAVTTNITK